MAALYVGERILERQHPCWPGGLQGQEATSSTPQAPPAGEWARRLANGGGKSERRDDGGAAAAAGLARAGCREHVP